MAIIVLKIPFEEVNHWFHGYKLHFIGPHQCNYAYANYADFIRAKESLQP